MSEAIPLTPLRYFVQVADCGSFTAAARELEISQPSLSVAIKKLEQGLETTLFSRDRSGVTLTRSGEVLLRHARHTLRALSIAREEIAALESKATGTFVLGCHESLAAYTLPGFMGKFLRAYPDISLSLWNGNSRDVEEAVTNRSVDLGLVVNPDPLPDAVITPLFEDRVEVIVSAALKKRVDGRVGRLLSEYPLLYVPEIRQCQYILSSLHEQGHRPSLLTCSSMELVKSLMLDGVGPAILPYRVASHGVAARRIVRAAKNLPVFHDKIALVRRYDVLVTQGLRVLIDSLVAHGSQMPSV